MMNTEIINDFIQPDWPAPANIKAYTTLRHSQVGIPQFESSPANPVPGNVDRRLLKQKLNLPAEPIWITQTHSTIALKATPENFEKEADATFTQEVNQICAVITADCLPLLICNQQGTHAAAIHAGWRGLANGIIETTLKQLNLPPEDTLIWLGPAIGPSKFEVRRDVFEAFTQNDPDTAQAFKLFEPEHWLANIYTLATMQLQKMGITKIYGGNYCTHTDAERFYSYRRDQGLKGRIVSLIWIANSKK